MKLLNAFGPNPRMVRMFLSEKGIELEGKQHLCGDRLTIGDLVLYCCTDFARGVGQTIDPGLRNVTGWFERMAARPSAEASLHPAAGKVGMRG